MQMYPYIIVNCSAINFVIVFRKRKQWHINSVVDELDFFYVKEMTYWYFGKK